MPIILLAYSRECSSVIHLSGFCIRPRELERWFVERFKSQDYEFVECWGRKVTKALFGIVGFLNRMLVLLAVSPERA